MDGDGGSLSSRDRFDRIEATLRRIEAKVEGKVDAAALERMGQRLRLVEAGETPIGRLMIDDFQHVKARVERLWEEGSRQAQDAESRVGEVEKTVAALGMESQQRAAVAKAERESIASRYRSWMFMLGAVQALTVVAVVVRALS